MRDRQNHLDRHRSLAHRPSGALATLHTNSAPESIIRLLDMGMDPLILPMPCWVLLTKRLAKRLCKCKAAHPPDDQEVEQLLNEYAGKS